MGAVNARSLQQMTKEVLEDRYDLVLHVGKSWLEDVYCDTANPMRIRSRFFRGLRLRSSDCKHIEPTVKRYGLS